MVDDLGDCESNFDEEFERTRRTFELLQQSGGGEYRYARLVDDVRHVQVTV